MRDVNSRNIERFQPTGRIYLKIAYTPRTRIRVNRECMDRYLLNLNKEKIIIPFKRQNLKTQNIGMPIIAHKTEQKKDSSNSQSFIITSVSKKSIKCKDDKVEYTIPVCDFHKYFYLGFCITVHAS